MKPGIQELINLIMKYQFYIIKNIDYNLLFLINH